jgi:hypothetical protein
MSSSVGSSGRAEGSKRTGAQNIDVFVTWRYRKTCGAARRPPHHNQHHRPQPAHSHPIALFLACASTLPSPPPMPSSIPLGATPFPHHIAPST